MTAQRIAIKDRQLFPFVLVPKAFFQRFSPTWRATLAFVALRYYANNDAMACENMSTRTLARIVNVSEDSMERGLAELKQKRVIVVHRRSRKSAAGNHIPQPNLYELVNLETVGGEPI